MLSHQPVRCPEQLGMALDQAKSLLSGRASVGGVGSVRDDLVDEALDRLDGDHVRAQLMMEQSELVLLGRMQPL